MKIVRMNPPGLFTPDGPFVQMTVAQGGKWIFVSGQVSVNEKGQIVGEGDIVLQARQTLENLKTSLAAQGAGLSDVAKVTVYLTNMAHRQEVAQIRRSFFGGNDPASTLVEVKALAHPDYLIEIEAIAVL